VGPNTFDQISDPPWMMMISQRKLTPRGKRDHLNQFNQTTWKLRVQFFFNVELETGYQLHKQVGVSK